MMKILTAVKVNLDKLDDAHIVKGARGRWLDLILVPTPKSPYGHTHMVVQGVPKEARAQGRRGPIVGNTVELRAESQPQPINTGA